MVATGIEADERTERPRAVPLTPINGRSTEGLDNADLKDAKALLEELK